MMGGSTQGLYTKITTSMQETDKKQPHLVDNQVVNLQITDVDQEATQMKPRGKLKNRRVIPIRKKIYDECDKEEHIRIYCRVNPNKLQCNEYKKEA